MSEMFRFQLEIQTGTFGTPLAEYCSGVSWGFLRESQTDFYASLALIVESSLLGGLSVQFLRVLLGVCARMRARESSYARGSQAGRAPLGCDVSSVWLRLILFVPWRVRHSSYASRVLLVDGLLPVLQVRTPSVRVSPPRVVGGRGRTATPSTFPT